MRSNIFLKLFLFFVASLSVIYGINLLVNKYSIFNYFRQQNKIYTLNNILKKKQKEKNVLLTEIELLKNPKVVNFDIIEKETIKKLNKIPPNYYMIIE